jgi:hypothetical protein
MKRVEQLLGHPLHEVRSGRSQTCWFYEHGTSPVSPAQVCFDHDRVSFVESPPAGVATYVVTSQTAAAP